MDEPNRNSDTAQHSTDGLSRTIDAGVNAIVATVKAAIDGEPTCGARRLWDCQPSLEFCALFVRLLSCSVAILNMLVALWPVRWFCSFSP